MLEITGKALATLRDAAREIGESEVTVATAAGVITFDFSNPHVIHARPLRTDSQPTRQELLTLLGVRRMKAA
jgi:hypothetical protein